MQPLRRRSPWLWSIIMGCILANSGCGGDAYEKQFDESLQHLKTTGQPLGRPQAAIDTTSSPAAAEGQQSSQ
jgi:hypothetical protein